MFLCVVCLIAGYLICDKLQKPEIITNICAEYNDVDSTNIILQARRGMINISDARKRFGKIFIDTLLIYRDSLIIRDSIRYKESEIPIEYIESDTTLSFSKHTEIDTLEVLLELKQRAYWTPLYCFEDSIKLKRFSYQRNIKPLTINKPELKDKIFWSLIGIGCFESLRLIAGIIK